MMRSAVTRAMRAMRAKRMMHLRAGATTWALAGGVAAVVALGLAARATLSSATQSPALERGNKPGEWRYWAADAWSTRYSDADQINARNFDSLQVAWRWDAGKYGEDEYYRTTPLYANGRLFTVATTRRKAFAIDPSTGQTLWDWGMDEGLRWQKAPRQFAGRGLAYWTDGTSERVIVITPGYHLASIDAKTGKPDPRFGKDGIVDLEEGLGFPLVPLAVDDSGSMQISEAAPLRRAKPGEKWDPVTKTGADGTMGIDPAHGQIANSSPAIVVNDVIIVGNSSMHGYYPLRLHNIESHIRGFDIHTGKQLWNFNLIPQPGEFGAETWKNGSKQDTPGTGKADAWAPYTADPALGLVYIPVGEGLSDEYGGHRPGDNLFANSIVALDVKTGARKWHYQAVHHDVWDYDFPMAPNLLDVTVNGQPRKIIAATSKQGWIYVLDRVTGKPIWPIPETPVLQSDVPNELTSPTQPVPSRPAPYSHQGLTAADLIDYTPAIKDSALKLAQHCRMGPYFIPPSPADGKGKSGPSQYKCSWYAPGASGGVNIDGGAAVDPATGWIYVGGQSGLGTIEVEHDPCSEHAYSQPHNSCGLIGALPAPAGVQMAGENVGTGFEPRAATTIAGVSILKPKELGGITAYDLNSGDKKWWVPNGNRWRDQTSNDPLFAGVQLPKVPALNGQAEVITTKTLVIHGTGRSGGPGGRGGRGGRGGGGGAGGGGANAAAPAGAQLYAFDKQTGKQVGAVSIPSVNTAVPMTFMHNGKQYIVFAYGQGSNIGLTALALPNR
ncbi:MAG TPA: PQQ-binding-like beta-propeller repeat protein [Gemmatimonadaceae bacterium]|nr:PQQ-binding-like beta-propeller repeat protein [Gemmatimonadaceae bacterium]